MFRVSILVTLICNKSTIIYESNNMQFENNLTDTLLKSSIIMFAFVDKKILNHRHL